jgi:hypothetical protein
LSKFYNEQGIWQELLRNKYLGGKTLGQVSKKVGDSHFWKSLVSVKDKFLSLGSFKLASGEEICFWEDQWLGNLTLMEQYPNIFNIARKKSAIVSDVLQTNPYNASFRRALLGVKLHEWQSLVARLVNISLVDGQDNFIWVLQKSGLFTVKSMYEHLINSGTKVSQEIWYMKIHLKIKVFMYYLKRGVILAKDNLAKRMWVCSNLCSFVRWKLSSISSLKMYLVLDIPPPTSVENLFNTWS